MFTSDIRRSRDMSRVHSLMPSRWWKRKSPGLCSWDGQKKTEWSRLSHPSKKRIYVTLSSSISSFLKRLAAIPNHEEIHSRHITKEYTGTKSLVENLQSFATWHSLANCRSPLNLPKGKMALWTLGWENYVKQTWNVKYAELCRFIKCYVMLSCVRSCHVVVRSVMLCYVVLCSIMLCYVVLHSVTLCYVVLHNVT